MSAQRTFSKKSTSPVLRTLTSYLTAIRVGCPSVGVADWVVGGTAVVDATSGRHAIEHLALTETLVPSRARPESGTHARTHASKRGVVLLVQLLLYVRRKVGLLHNVSQPAN